MKKILAGVAFCLAVSSAAFSGTAKAESQEYTFDKGHSQILWEINHLGFSISHGGFMEFDGSLSIDEAAIENSKVSVTINTASLNSGHDGRDEHLRSKDFFNVAEFPSMEFVSTSVEKTSDTTAVMTGDLTLLGVTKPMTLDVTLVGRGKHPFADKQVAGFSAHGTIKRSEWGMSTFVPAVSDEVSITIETETSPK